MLLDQQALFSDAQAITSSAASTNIYDAQVTGADISNVGDGLFLVLDATVAFTASGSATLTAVLQASDDSAFGSGVSDVITTGAIPKATLVAGYRVFIPVPPGRWGRYWRVNYTVATGPMTAGKMLAGFVDAASTAGQTAYASGLNMGGF